MLRHAIQLTLQLLGSDWPLRVILQRLRVAQIVFNFLFELCLRYHLVQRWLGAGVSVWPDPVTPVNVFNSSLMRYALCKREGPLRSFYWCFGTDKSQQRSVYDRTYRSCANKKCDRSAQVEETRHRNSSRARDPMSELSSAYLFHK